MRPINEIIVHCSATIEGQWFDVADIRQWHLDRGWSDIGYHWVVYLDGSVNAGRPEGKIGAHVEGHNDGTLGICYVGGLDANKAPKDTRTLEQKAGLESALRDMMARYPAIDKISGHQDYANKACPCFDAAAEYAHLVGAGRSLRLADRIVHAFRWPSFNTHERAFDGPQELPVLRDGIYDNSPGGEARWFCVVVDGQEMWIHEQDVAS